MFRFMQVSGPLSELLPSQVPSVKCYRSLFQADLLPLSVEEDQRNVAKIADWFSELGKKVRKGLLDFIWLFSTVIF